MPKRTDIKSILIIGAGACHSRENGNPARRLCGVECNFKLDSPLRGNDDMGGACA